MQYGISSPPIPYPKNAKNRIRHLTLFYSLPYCNRLCSHLYITSLASDQVKQMQKFPTATMRRSYTHYFSITDIWCVIMLYFLQTAVSRENLYKSIGRCPPVHIFNKVVVAYFHVPWWRHQMETFSALLVICAGNSPVPGEFPAQRPVTRSFDVFLICTQTVE